MCFSSHTFWKYAFLMQNMCKSRKTQTKNHHWVCHTSDLPDWGSESKCQGACRHPDTQDREAQQQQEGATQPLHHVVPHSVEVTRETLAQEPWHTKDHITDIRWSVFTCFTTCCCFWNLLLRLKIFCFNVFLHVVCCLKMFLFLSRFFDA